MTGDAASPVEASFVVALGKDGYREKDLGEIRAGRLRIQTFQKSPLHRLAFSPDAPADPIPIPCGVVQCLFRRFLANVCGLHVHPQDIKIFSLSF